MKKIGDKSSDKSRNESGQPEKLIIINNNI